MPFLCDYANTCSSSPSPAPSPSTVEIPVGGIIMYSGSIGTDGTLEVSGIKWALCDGNNGTPDLRSKFIIGAGANGAAVVLNDTGGSHPVTKDASSSKLEMLIDDFPSHVHGATFQGKPHSHTGVTGDNNQEFGIPVGPSGSDASGIVNENYTPNIQDKGTTFFVSPQHTHNIPADTADGTVTIDAAPVNGEKSVDYLPPSYALYYIMRIS